MTHSLDKKSSIQDIQARFDKDVARFSTLETGQSTTIDAPLAMELITQAAVNATPNIRRVLDIGCGAGNNTLKLFQSAGSCDCDLIDLSLPMLDKAKERIQAINTGQTRSMQGDFRTLPLENKHYDVILAAAVLHHLRDDADWEAAFQKIYDILAPGGSVWITDLVTQDNPAVHDMMWARYGDYLSDMGGDAYRDSVFAYIAEEDSPRSLTYQLNLLQKVGFEQVEILHKNSCFAAFGAIKKLAH